MRDTRCHAIKLGWKELRNVRFTPYPVFPAVLIAMVPGLLTGALASSSLNFATVADGTLITVTDEIVTAVWPDCFYIEQQDRTCGIKAVPTASLSPGTTVDITGTLATVGNERQITTNVVTIKGTTTAAPAPLVMRCGDAGGAAMGFSPGVTNANGLYNIGLRIQLCGKVSEVFPDNFKLDDGSGSVKVVFDGSPPPQNGKTVVVTGISSVDNSSGFSKPLIRATGVTTWHKWFPKKIVFAGDSLSSGLDASEASKAFSSRLLERLRTTYPNSVFESRFLAPIGGSYITNIAAAINADVGAQPDLVIIQDAALGSGAGWLDGARTAIENARKHWPKAPRIYFCDSWNPIGAPAPCPSCIESVLSPQLAALCAEYGDDVRMVPIFAPGRAQDGYGGIQFRMYNPDGGNTWTLRWDNLQTTFPHVYNALNSGNVEELYLGDEYTGTGGPWITLWQSKIIGVTPTTITTAEPRGVPSGSYANPGYGKIAQSSYRRNGVLGDTLHPTNIGHEVIANALFTIIKSDIDAANPR